MSTSPSDVPPELHRQLAALVEHHTVVRIAREVQAWDIYRDADDVRHYVDDLLSQHRAHALNDLHAKITAWLDRIESGQEKDHTQDHGDAYVCIKCLREHLNETP